MMDWMLTILATIASLCSWWLYGNKSWKAPLLGLVAGTLYTYYDIRYDQLPLLIPTFAMMSIQVRNLVKMDRKGGAD